MCSCAAGWSDIALFAISNTGTILPIRYVFMSRMQKNRQIRPHARAAHARQSLHFQTITRTLKINENSENLQISSCNFKEQSPKRKIKSKFFNTFFEPPKWQIGFKPSPRKTFS